MISVKMIVKLKVYDQRNSFISHSLVKRRKLYDNRLKVYDHGFERIFDCFFERMFRFI